MTFRQKTYKFYTGLVSILFVLFALVLIITAFLLPGPDSLKSSVIPLYSDRRHPAWVAVPWEMTLADEQGEFRAIPSQPGRAWCGFRFQRTRKIPEQDYRRPRLTAGWLKRGALMLDLAGVVDAQGHQAPPPLLQFFFFTTPQEKIGHGIRLRPWHDAGQVKDSSGRLWQSVVIPMSLFDIPGDATLFAVALQVVGPCHHSFAVRRMKLALLDEKQLSRHMAPAPGTADFPALMELSRDLLPPKKALPVLKNGTFFVQDRPTFLLSAQSNYDMRLDIWGFSLTPPTRSGEKWAGYEKRLTWLYETLPDYAQLVRLGFNSWCLNAPPESFLNPLLTEPLRKRESFDPKETGPLVERIALPISMDLTALPDTLGELRAKSRLARAVFSPEGGHMMPFSMTPEGKAYYMAYFKAMASFCQDNAIPVFQYELFNEPDYRPGSARHAKDFNAYLKAHHPDAADLAGKPPTDSLLSWHYHCEYLSDLFQGLVQEGAAVIKQHYRLGPALCTVQCNRQDILSGTALIAPDKLFARLPIIAAPTDGGLWTHGACAASPPDHPIQSPVAPAPMTADLLAAFSGGRKPVIDPEMTCPGDPREVFAALWTRVLLGYDGVCLFAWSKHAWKWHTQAEAQFLAEHRPYCLLNPYGMPPAALAALARFRRTLAPVEGWLLEKPFGVPPMIGFLHSYANERAHAVQTTDRREGRSVYAALRYSGLPMALVTEDQLNGHAEGAIPYKAIVASGLTVLHQETINTLTAYRDAGGLVFLVNAPLDSDPLGRPLQLQALTGGAKLGERDHDDIQLPAAIAQGFGANEPVAGTAFRLLSPGHAVPVLRDNKDGLRVVSKAGARGGTAYTIAFSGHGYGQLALLLWLFKKEGITPPWTLTDPETHWPVVNVLLSIRDRGDTKAILLANQDGYDKAIQFKWPGLKSDWHSRLCLPPAPGERGVFQGAKGFSFKLPGNAVQLILISRNAPSGQGGG